MSTKPELTDEQLVLAVREKDKELYSEIIKRYSKKIGHYLCNFIKDEDERQDVIQLVFIKAYRNLYDFDANRRFSPWLYRIAHNEALNYLKKYKKESLFLDEKEWEVADEKFDLDEKIDSKILKTKIEKGLLKLKDKYREALLLYFFEQKTYEEIGDILQVPRNTVGVFIMRGKKALKEILKNEKI